MASHSATRGSERLAREIADRSVRTLFDRFVKTYGGIHSGVRREETSVDVRFFFGSTFLCRLAPYRDLFHTQVGDNPAWETRVRDKAGYFESFDRALQQFLRAFAASGR